VYGSRGQPISRQPDSRGSSPAITDARTVPATVAEGKPPWCRPGIAIVQSGEKSRCRLIRRVLRQEAPLERGFQDGLSECDSVSVPDGCLHLANHVKA
jgi:hypothetical protein